MLEVQGLTRRYGDKIAVDDLSFVARDGEVTGFVGPNGAGKSTTMRMLLGLERPTSGAAHIDGRDYHRLDRPMTHVGAMLDAGWVNGGRSARGHLTFLAQTGGLPRDRVDAVLARVGLTDVAGKRVGGFSLGMRQRLGLAAALMGEPRHLVLDEPLNGLDPEGVHWMRRLIRDYAARGNSVLVSSHLLSELSMTADSLVVIGRGRLIGQYATDEFVSSMSSGTVRVRVDRMDVLREAALARGWTVDDSGDGALSVRAVASTEGEPATLSTDEVGALCFDAGLRVGELTAVTASLEDAYLLATGDAVDYQATETTQEGAR